MKKNIKKIISNVVLLFLVTQGAVAQVIINTSSIPPVSPFLNQIFSQAGSGVHVMLLYPKFDSSLGNPTVRIFGKLERISPSPFTIEVKDTLVGAFIELFQGARNLSSNELQQAFGNFNENNLSFTGISPNELKVGNNYKLPDGVYRICFYAQARKYIKVPTSDPFYSYCCTTMVCFCPSVWVLNGPSEDVANPGCATFTICNQAGGAPQFTQPVNNLNINSEIALVRPVSPVIFTWLPPQSTCGLPPGGFVYDFEIWELFANQTVTDAINNPLIFQKTALPSTTFLLDTNLNRNVLQEGKRYAIRVRAVSRNANSTVDIDNSGYSRIEAFQYGGNAITQNGIPDPQDYYIQFDERKSDYWDNVYDAYKRRGRGDTLVPIKEYIALALTQNGTAYNEDAIELFLALNPELADVKKVKLSYMPKLPEFPEVEVNDQRNFDKEHITNLEPDNIEKNKFLRYLDTLNTHKYKIPENAGKVVNDLISYLNTVKPEADSIDRVTVSLVNQVLSELLYELRQYPKEANKNQYSQLLKLSSTLQELTALSPNSTSFFYSFPAKNESSLSSYKALMIKYPKQIFSTNSSLNDIENDSPERVLSAIMKQLLPFDVIVYRNSTVAPYKPVLDAPDLAATYRIFYTLSSLYNHKNPEVNAKSTSRLASTIQISLPSNTVFSFWALNMLNHKMTQAEDVDLKDVLINSMKNRPGLKKPSIVLKVN